MHGAFSKPPGWELFNKILVVSLVLHAAALAAALFIHMPGARRMFFAPVYNVSLVDPGVLKKAAPPQVKKTAPPPKPEPAQKTAPKPEPVKKTAPMPTSEKAVKIQAPEMPKESVSVESAIDRLRSKVAKAEQEAEVRDRIEGLKEAREREERRVAESLAALREELASREAAEAPAPPGEETPSAPGGRVTMENLQAEHPDYYRAIHDAVWENWIYPVKIGSRDVAVIVGIKISRSGELLDQSLERSSGDAFFDQSLMNAIKKSAPFPPLPEDIKGEYLDTGLRFCPGCTE